MLTLDRISKYHGSSPVLVEVTLGIPPRARIGVVGPNGVGKSTLLRIAAGLEEPDEGTVARTPASLTVGYLAQEVGGLQGETLLDYLARRSEPAEVDAEAGRVLAGVGLSFELLDRPIGSLSGGQAARAALAAILLTRVDVLLLDEPTNDLDFHGLERLERFVARTDAAVVVVSHDRDFLDRTVRRVVELDEWTHRAREYAGGWSEYEIERERERSKQYTEFERYEETRRALEQQLTLRRTRARSGRALGDKTGGADRRPTKALASKVRATERRLAQLEGVQKPYEPWELRLSLAPLKRSGRVVARLEGAVVERGDFRLGPVDLEVDWGERVALVGPNGSGKTTLIEALLGTIPLASGRRYVGPGVVLGELDQERRTFDTKETLLEAFQDASNTLLLDQDARTLLAKFGLGADDVLRKGRSLSPGERTRAVIALLAARGVNFLVMDEPTNHLDLPAIEELEEAVAGYDGTVLLVTHDRRFLEGFAATRTIELAALSK